MSLSDADRLKLMGELQANRKRQPFSRDHELVGEVLGVIDDLRQEGRREFRAKELVGHVDEEPRTIGHALRVLYDNGVIGREGGQTPYRWVIDP
jgi:DNA-binding transcriptional ArsR family regulator